MNRDQFITYVTSNYGSSPEYLWKSTPSTCIFSHTSNKKWFCAVLTVKKNALKTQAISGSDSSLIDMVNFKAHPLFINSLKEKNGILPGYHMNKEHWITVLLGDQLSNTQIKELLNESYHLTK